jgi:hypothetical protein
MIMVLVVEPYAVVAGDYLLMMKQMGMMLMLQLAMMPMMVKMLMSWDCSMPIVTMKLKPQKRVKVMVHGHQHMCHLYHDNILPLGLHLHLLMMTLMAIDERQLAHVNMPLHHLIDQLCILAMQANGVRKAMYV